MRKRNGLKSAAFAIAAFALVASACGGDDADDTATEDTVAEETTEETTAPLPGAGILACMVTDTGGVDEIGRAHV